jgi:HK97 family phage prohead protease
MKKEDIEKVHPNAEARMFKPNFKVKVEKRMEDDKEMEYTMIEGVGVVLDEFTDMGWYREKINSRAFDNCDMTDVVSCFNHDPNKVCSRTTGKADDLTISIEDKKVMYRYAIKNECAEYVAKDIALGFVTGSSFMFMVRKDSWGEAEDGTEEREILEVEKVYELGAVTFPAYPTTTVAARSRDLSKPKSKTGLEIRNELKLELAKNKLKK